MTEKEKSLQDIYKLFINICSNQDPRLDLLDDIVVKEVMGYGTTFDEKIESLDALKNLIISQKEQSSGLEMEWIFTPVLRYKTLLGDVAIIIDEVKIHVKSNDVTTQLFVRFTTFLEYINKKWQVIHWHGSKPENVVSEEDTYGIQEWKRKNAELEQKVAEKTAELQKSLEDLKATQAQLIHSEKMASLGELTAGIAHEIQNPLNFVNNFSEVSNELIDEMNVELDKGEIEEAKFIAADIKQNLEKINHHGKRADAIVKGMLQHSKSSSGKKEPIDLNALGDEYLRLSYHGLRAKDKSFNATMNTDFDDSIGKINIIPQDLGRVVLNLINNAFYAVDQRLKACQVEPVKTDKTNVTNDAQPDKTNAAQPDNADVNQSCHPELVEGSKGYEPTVSITTKKVGDKVEIRVSDNGNGIPQKVLDKIFQPFFTTKPAGQGTGLGLSLSYDIVKAHGGEIKVESQTEDALTAGKAGTTFTIALPNN